MFHFRYFFILFSLFWISTVSASVIGKKFKDNNIQYQITSPTTCKAIQVLDRKLQTVNFPASVKYKKVEYTLTELGDNVMHRTSRFNKYIELEAQNNPIVLMHKKDLSYATSNIIIPNTVTIIGNSAFEGCKNISEINIPNSVTKIGSRAFADCEALNYVYLPESVQYIGGEAFDGCPSISEVVKPAKIKKSIFPGYSDITFTEINNIDHLQNTALNDNKKTSPTLSENLKSDIDINIPIANARNSNTFAIIIANENYLSEVPVKYAHNDGRVVKNYLNQAIGLPEENIRFSTDATRNQYIIHLDWLKEISSAFDGNINIIFYYAGHGMPDEASGTPFLIPVDGLSSNPNTCLSVKELYDTLASIPSLSTLIVMDACFSGSQRGDGMLVSARGVKIKSKQTAPTGKMVVFTSAQGDETAYPYVEKKHGLFTYFFIKKIQESNGDATMKDIVDYVSDNVRQKSILINGKSQTPAILTSPIVGDNWQNWKLK